MPTRIPFPWPFKGVNVGWPLTAQPSLSSPDALNVLTDEPQRGRARGGSRNGTKKACEDQLGDGTSRRLSGLWQVTKLTVDEGTEGSGGAPSGLYQLATNQDYFADSTNINAHMEDLYPTFAVGTDDVAGTPLAKYLARFDGVRGGTFAAADPMYDGNAGVIAFNDSGDTGSAAAVRDSNYHASDNFLVELHGIVGATAYAFLSARVFNGNVTSLAGVLTLQLEINGPLDTFTISLWKNTTLINAVTQATDTFGYFRMGIRLTGTTAQVQLNGVAAFTTSVGSTTASHRGVAFGAYQEGTGGSPGFYQIRALEPTTSNDFTTLNSADDFSTYATGQQAEATGPFDVGTADQGAPAGLTDQTEFLAMLNGTRAGTDPADGDSGTLGDDGDPFIQTVNPAITLAGALVRRTGDLTPADSFEVRLPFDRDSNGNGPALCVRIKSGTPTDSDGVISARWRPIFAASDVHADWVLFLGDTIVSRGAGVLPQDSTSAIGTTSGVLKLRVEGELVSILVDDVLICSGIIAGQNTAARGVAFGAWATTDVAGPIDTIKIRGLDVYDQDTATGGSPGETVRDTRLIAVAGEDVYSGTLGGPYTKIDNVRDTQRKPSLTDVNGLVYLVDGEDYVKVIDPIAVTADDLVASGGSVPLACTIAVTWRGRLVLSGQEDLPQNIYMSKAGDPTDWNYSPGVPNALQAIDLNASDAGRIGQPVIALVPYHDDTLLIGCDHGLYVVTGDPAAGGTVEAISDGIGFTTRDGWCMSPDGTIYFVGTSGFYRMQAGGSGPVNVALGKYQQYFQELDRASNYIMCTWDRDRVGCWIFVVPRIEGAESTHLWFDAKQEAFWPMRLPTNQGPLATIVYDGDSPTDRYTLLGGHDGYIRRFDKEADQDDGVAITSYVFLGPVNPGGSFADFKIVETEWSLGVPSNGMDYELRVGENAEGALTATADFSGRFTTAGRQEKVRSRARGNTFLYRIGNTVISKAWVLERVEAIFEPSGRKR